MSSFLCGLKIQAARLRLDHCRSGGAHIALAQAKDTTCEPIIQNDCCHPVNVGLRTADS